ncbi:MAG TPA: hypothetical protein VFQ61_00925 [Polyangiaceae bacterium]|nr:hypothetical protein [Polyangiaceae bacterium]
MFSLYAKVAVLAARRAVQSWPVALSLLVYAVILLVASQLTRPLGILGGMVMGLVLAACWSSYLELISRAIEGGRFRVSWEDFQKTFGARFWDVVSVMFAFWLLSLLTYPLTAGAKGPAFAAITGFAIAFFFNVVPELLYQGSARSFLLLMESARFMLDHAPVWLLPNLLFAAAWLGAAGALDVRHPVELLILFGNTFSSPLQIAQVFGRLPLWALPIELIGLHYVMVFRGLLFRALASGRRQVY